MSLRTIEISNNSCVNEVSGEGNPFEQRQFIKNKSWPLQSPSEAYDNTCRYT